MLTNVVEDFQKKQSSKNSKNRYRDRSNSRDRDNSGDSYRNKSRDRHWVVGNLLNVTKPLTLKKRHACM